METTKKINRIHYLIVLACCLLFRFVPPFGGLTPLGMGLLGSFIGAVYGWVVIDTLWTSFMALLGLGLTIGMNAMLAASFGSSTVVALITCFMVVGVAMKSGAFSWLAMKLLTNKYLEGKGYLTLFVVFVVAWAISSWNPIVMCIIFSGFLISIFEQVGVKKDDPLVLFSFLGLAYQLMRSQIMFPFLGGGLAYLNAYNNMFPTLPLPVMKYILIMFIMGIIMAVVLVALMKFVFRVDVSPLSGYKVEGGVPPVTKTQVMGLLMFVAFIVLNVLANVGPFTAILSQWGIVGISIGIGALVPLLRDEHGEPVANLGDLMKMVSWDMVAMLGYIMAISAQMMNPASGISTAIAHVFNPFLTMPPLVFIIFVFIFCVILTNFANNMLATVLCLPFLISYAQTIGMSPIGMVCLLFIMSEFALATPAASPVTAVVFAQSDWVTTPAMSKAAVKLLIPLFLVFMVIAWPLQAIIF